MLKYLISVFIIFILFIINIIKNKISIGKFFALKTIFVVLLLEVTVFNINSYKTDFGKLKHISFSKNELINKVNYTTNNTQYISIDNINTKVKSIYLKLDNLKENEIVDYDIFYSDESTSSRYLASKTYCDNVEKTKYCAINLSRKL